MNLWHEQARATWPGCVITGDQGPFVLIVHRFNQAPLAFLFTDASSARYEQQQHGGQIQTIAPMKRPKPFDLGWE